MLSVLEETANSAVPAASGFCTTCGCHPQCQAKSRGLMAVLSPPQTLRGWVAELRCPLRGATKRVPHPHPPMLPCPKWPPVPPPPPFCSRTRESPAPWRGAGRLQVGLAGEWPGPSGAARGQDGGCRWRPVAAWPHHPPPIAAIPAPAASRPPSRCASAPQRGGAGLILGPGGGGGR